MDTIAVLIPCYNEALTIAKVVRDYKRCLPEATIYVYDNNSSDDTARLAAEAGADRVELYTESYASAYAAGREKAIAPFLATAQEAARFGLGVNGGHDLNLENLEYYIRTIPWTDEVSIGHAIICDALYMGLERTIQAYLSKIRFF